MVTEILEIERGVLAVAARGRIVSDLRSLLRDDALEPTFQLGTKGDVALLLRERRELVVRLQGRAEALLVREGGRVTWVEGGLFHYPGSDVVALLVVVGLEVVPDLRTSLEAWILEGADPTSLLSACQGHLEEVVCLLGRDEQKRTVSADEVLDDDETDEGLLDLLTEVAEWDDRATPDVVRRVAGPQSEGVHREIAPWVYEAEPVSTARESGPPFQPVLLVGVGESVDDPPSFEQAVARLDELQEPPTLEPEPAASLEEPPRATLEPEPAELREEPTEPDSLEPSSSPRAEVDEPSPDPSEAPTEEPASDRTVRAEADEADEADEGPQPVSTPEELERARPFSLDPYSERLTTNAPPTPERTVPLWSAVVFALIVIGTTFLVSWIYLID